MLKGLKTISVSRNYCTNLAQALRRGNIALGAKATNYVQQAHSSFKNGKLSPLQLVEAHWRAMRLDVAEAVKLSTENGGVGISWKPASSITERLESIILDTFSLSLSGKSEHRDFLWEYSSRTTPQLGLNVEHTSLGEDVLEIALAPSASKQIYEIAGGLIRSLSLFQNLMDVNKHGLHLAQTLHYKFEGDERMSPHQIVRLPSLSVIFAALYALNSDKLFGIECVPDILPPHEAISLHQRRIHPIAVASTPTTIHGATDQHPAVALAHDLFAHFASIAFQDRATQDLSTNMLASAVKLFGFDFLQDLKVNVGFDLTVQVPASELLYDIAGSLPPNAIGMQIVRSARNSGFEAKADQFAKEFKIK